VAGKLVADVRTVELVEPESTVVNERRVGRGLAWGVYPYPGKWHGRVNPWQG
jgi:hypothetical protein